MLGTTMLVALSVGLVRVVTPSRSLPSMLLEELPWPVTKQWVPLGERSSSGCTWPGNRPSASRCPSCATGAPGRENAADAGVVAVEVASTGAVAAAGALSPTTVPRGSTQIH